MTQNAAGELSMTERAISTGVGLALAAAAAKPRPNQALSLLVLAAGAFLAYRGSTGFCPLKAMMEEAR